MLQRTTALTPRAATDYLCRHWHGALPLGVSFWINLVALRVALMFLGQQLPVVIEPATGAYFWFAIVFHGFDLLIVLPWQGVGVVRACRPLISDAGEQLSVLVSQFGVVLALVVAGGNAFATFAQQHQPAPVARSYTLLEQERQNRYVIAVNPTADEVSLVGDLEMGLARRLREVLEAYPTIRTLLLESDGGYVSQGRAIAAIVMEYGLDTRVERSCKSSCTLAFAAGATRRIGPDARLGFHQYLYRAQTTNPLFDQEAEYLRDIAFFESRGVDPALFEQAFSTTHNEIWYPPTADLIAVGVVHEVATR